MSNLSSKGREWDATRLRILERDDYICGYGCGREADTVDHIIPKEQNGTDEDTNLIAACRTCNGRKGARVMVRINYVNHKWIERI